MLGNTKQIAKLMLLMNTASIMLAVPFSAKAESAEERLQRLINNSNRVQARLQQQVDSQETEIMNLRGTIERNDYQMNQMLERQRQLFIELDKLRTKVNELESAPRAASTTTGTVSPDLLQAGEDEQSAYQSAVNLILQDKDYDSAITAFNQFLTQYPESSYITNSHYWLGQLYFARKSDVDAAKHFVTVVADKESSKRADALNKLGDIAKRNNNQKTANKYYQQVIDEYPNSSAAKLAEENL